MLTAPLRRTMLPSFPEHAPRPVVEHRRARRSLLEQYVKINGHPRQRGDLDRSPGIGRLDVGAVRLPPPGRQRALERVDSPDFFVPARLILRHLTRDVREPGGRRPDL